MAIWRGRDRDRDRGGACRYSRRGLRLRRRGAYGIHRASSPWCQAKGCVERLHPTGETTHYDLCVAGAPANHVRCASLRSGGRRLAVRKTIEYQIGALPRTPFPATRDFPSRGNKSVTGLAFYVIWYDKHSADWLAALASPYPAAPDFSTGKRVTRFSGRFAPLRIVFPCHPIRGTELIALCFPAETWLHG